MTAHNEGQPPDDDDNPKRTRLEDEVLEILAQADRPPSFSDHVRRKAERARREQRRQRTSSLNDVARQAGPGTMLLGCFLAAVLAYLVRDVSAILANVFAAISVALLIMPILQRFRSPNQPGPKRWRGRDVDFDQRSPKWVDNLRDRFRGPPRM